MSIYEHIQVYACICNIIIYLTSIKLHTLQQNLGPQASRCCPSHVRLLRSSRPPGCHCSAAWKTSWPAGSPASTHRWSCRTSPPRPWRPRWKHLRCGCTLGLRLPLIGVGNGPKNWMTNQVGSCFLQMQKWFQISEKRTSECSQTLSFLCHLWTREFTRRESDQKPKQNSYA